MKKLFASALLAALLLIMFTGVIIAQTPENAAFEEPEEAEAPIEYSYEELNVAGVTPMTGSFFNSLWGNITSDMDVRMLLHGYDLVYWQTEAGVFLPNQTVISGIDVDEDAEGNRTFTIVLYNDLYYSDGSRITAWDYAFSTLLTMSPEAEAIGGNVKHPEYLLGYDEYISGQVPYLAGFRVISDDQMVVTISADYLPFFYEMGLLDCVPYPVSVIAPGVRTADDGNGIYLTNIEEGEPLFTADLLRETILDPETGYMSHPAVTSGPYKLVSFDGQKADFEINGFYKGDAEGNLPSIPRLTYQSMAPDELISAFETGKVGLLNKVTTSDLIMAGMAAAGANSRQLAFANYPRTGLGFISFNTERPVVDETEVRQALAKLIDRDAFIESTVGNFGLRADGYYGLGQWMYQVLSGAIAPPVPEPEDDSPAAQAEYDRQVAAWEELSADDLPVIDYDPEEAAALLESAGWDLNADGGPFRRGEDDLRYKQISGELLPLRLTLAFPEGSTMEEALRTAAASLQPEGIELTVYMLPLADLVQQFYGTRERDYDMFFLASNFDIMFDPSSKFVINDEGIPVWTETGLADQELYDAAVEMRTTKPGELLTYCANWLKFQERFNEVMPMLPIYSNIYFDFYQQILQDYQISSSVSWSQAVIPAFLADLPEEEAEEDDFDDFDIEEGVTVLELD